MELKYTLKVDTEGNIKIVNRKMFISEMKQYFAGTQVIATFRKPKKLRSNAQNGYYWSCVIPEVFDALVNAGYDAKDLSKDIIHDMLRHKFLTKDLPSPDFNGEFITITKSTSELGVGEFLDYIAEIQRWAATYLGHTIPDPNQQKEIDY